MIYEKHFFIDHFITQQIIYFIEKTGPTKKVNPVLSYFLLGGALHRVRVRALPENRS